jgi:hypothetical protein
LQVVQQVQGAAFEIPVGNAPFGVRAVEVGYAARAACGATKEIG